MLLCDCSVVPYRILQPFSLFVVLLCPAYVSTFLGTIDQVVNLLLSELSTLLALLGISWAETHEILDVHLLIHWVGRRDRLPFLSFWLSYKDQYTMVLIFHGFEIFLCLRSVIPLGIHDPLPGIPIPFFGCHHNSFVGSELSSGFLLLVLSFLLHPWWELVQIVIFLWLLTTSKG